MKSLRYILEVDTTDYDKKRTSDPTSKPKKKKNVLFIGDANTRASNSYAKQIINSGIVTGEIRASFEGTAQEILKLVRAHNADNYDIVSIQYSNIFPTKLNNDIDALRVAFDEAVQFGAKLIVITNASKEHVPYAHVKYETDEAIWNWLSNQQTESDYTIDIRQITNNKSFFEKNGVIFNKDTQNMISRLWLDVLADIDPKANTGAVVSQEKRKELNKQKTKKKLNYIKGQKSNDLIPIQKRLRALGYEISDKERGTMGDGTIEAIKKFQVLNGLAVSGQLSDKMISLLNSPKAKQYSDWQYAVKNILGVDEQEPDKESINPNLDDSDEMQPPGNYRPSTLANIPKNASEFITMWANVAKKHQTTYGIPASITLAQAALESGWGKSGLSTKYNNFFGITGAYKGKSVQLKNKKGQLFTWRVYDTPEQSFEDHADLLVRKYKPSNSNPSVDDWAQSLSNRGYAEAGYGDSLLNMIAQYGLDKYDIGGGTNNQDSSAEAEKILNLPFSYKNIASLSTYPGKDEPLESDKYFIIHHTAGRGSAEQVVSVLNARKLGVQWVVDRDGKIYQTLPAGSRGAHILTSKLGPSNSNSQGVEVIAKNDDDVLPVQSAAVLKLIKSLGYSPSQIYGHGEVNPGHKAESEGQTIKRYIQQNYSN
jgi:flagellum-specific peptidoglycan hydrolase FlgJ